MEISKTSFRLSPISAFAICFSFFAASALAQEANVLGLPAVPQPKPGAASNAGNSASAPKASPIAPINRDLLSGEMGLQHSALNGLGRLIVTTRSTFTTAGAKSNAIDAARSVQRDLSIACGKQCKPEKMTPPKILPGGQLEFELSVRPLHQHLTQAQFLAALQSKPLNLTPAQLAVPSPAPVTASPAAESSAAPTGAPAK